MQYKLNVSIGIAAYNAEKNIGKMLEELLGQKQNGFLINEIIVHSDNSSDNTVKISKSFKSEKIKVIDNKYRKGFAGSIKSILEETSQDVIVLLNDDIQIDDNELIGKLIDPFYKEKGIGLVCGNPQPIRPKTFLEKAIISTFNSYKEMANLIKAGNNVFTVDGKILVLSKALIDKISFPRELKDMGNVDAYFYFICLKNKLAYKYVAKAVVYYKNPLTIHEYINWVSRNNSNAYIMEKQFGRIVESEYKKPWLLFYKLAFYEMIKNPLGCLFIFFLRFYINTRSHILQNDFNPKWEVISTTKEL